MERKISKVFSTSKSFKCPHKEKNSRFKTETTRLSDDQHDNLNTSSLKNKRTSQSIKMIYSDQQNHAIHMKDNLKKSGNHLLSKQATQCYFGTKQRQKLQKIKNENKRLNNQNNILKNENKVYEEYFNQFQQRFKQQKLLIKKLQFQNKYLKKKESVKDLISQEDDYSNIYTKRGMINNRKQRGRVENGQEQKININSMQKTLYNKPLRSSKQQSIYFNNNNTHKYHNKNNKSQSQRRQHQSIKSKIKITDNNNNNTKLRVTGIKNINYDE